MRTLVIISHQAFSLVNFRGPLIADLVSENIRVYALAPDYDDELRKQMLVLGALPIDFCLARAGMNPWRDFVDMFKLVVLLRSLHPDVTLGYTIKPVIYGTLAAWLARVPRRVAMIEGLGYVFTCSGATMSWKRKLLLGTVSLLYRVALSRAHRVVFLNRDDNAEFVNGGLVDLSKVVHLGGIGVDLDEWLPAPAVTTPVTFLLVARLLREKGIVEYAEAARLVKALHPGTRFLLLGGLDPNPGGLSQAEVQSWVNEGLLEWPGHVEVKPWLVLTSVFVLPSYREGLPRSTQEAMSMGRPVITTDVPGCRETVIDGVNGYLVPVREAAALAEAMTRFVVNPTLIESMGCESRRMAEDQFDVHKINARMLKILDVE
jgi:glycosyltransferase involved in cell wall biosynthesis